MGSTDRDFSSSFPMWAVALTLILGAALGLAGVMLLGRKGNRNTEETDDPLFI